MSDLTTYMTSKVSMKYFVPHSIQNLVIRTRVQKDGHDYRLPYTEVSEKNAYPVLKTIVQMEHPHTVYFYSLQMLPFESPHLIAQIYDYVNRGATLIFCVEDIILSKASLESFKELIKLEKISLQKVVLND